MDSNFDLNSYGNMISKIQNLGYKIVFFEDLEIHAAHLILRHDIDISLESALKMATFEASKNLHSTYFILLRSNFYNIFSSVATKIIKEILSLGHKIGLHFDHSIYKNLDSASIDKYCEKECYAIESWFNIQINSISFHKPSKYLLSLDKNIAGRINTYHSTYFKKILYCSDSRGNWHYGDPISYIENKNNQAIQLLTHPIWWDTNCKINYKINPERKLEQYALKNIKSFCNALSLNTEVFKSDEFLDKLRKLE